jgi:hypothetical protein
MGAKGEVQQGMIFLSDGLDEKTATTSIIYHELVHVAYHEKDREADKIPSIGGGTQKHYGDYRGVEYFLSANEYSSYIGQLYQAVAYLASDEKHNLQAKEFLRKGDVSSIFQMLNPQRIERIIYQLYFGGNDQEAIEILKEKGLKDNLISTLQPEKNLRLRREFNQSIYAVLTGNYQKTPLTVTVNSILAYQLEILGLWNRYEKLGIKKEMYDSDVIRSFNKSSDGRITGTETRLTGIKFSNYYTFADGAEFYISGEYYSPTAEKKQKVDRDIFCDPFFTIDEISNLIIDKDLIRVGSFDSKVVIGELEYAIPEIDPLKFGTIDSHRNGVKFVRFESESALKNYSVELAKLIKKKQDIFLKELTQDNKQKLEKYFSI